MSVTECQGKREVNLLCKSEEWMHYPSGMAGSIIKPYVFKIQPTIQSISSDLWQKYEEMTLEWPWAGAEIEEKNSYTVIWGIPTNYSGPREEQNALS